MEIITPTSTRTQAAKYRLNEWRYWYDRIVNNNNHANHDHDNGSGSAHYQVATNQTQLSLALQL